MLKTCLWAISAISLVCWFASPARAQAQISSADLKGTITDATRAVIRGATVTAVNQGTNAVRTAMTDESGDYRLLLLPPGEYEIRVEMAGFASQVRRGIVLTVGQTAALDVQLQAGAIATTMEVSMSAPLLIETERTHQASTLTQRPIQNLPINGRGFLSFTLLTPGVVEENPSVTSSMQQQLPSSRLIFAGQSGRSNNVTIDGVDNSDIAGNGVRPTISQEAVLEFQINQHSYSAEFGRASAGTINIVSKSGTNQLRGNLYNYFRHEHLDARNTFATGLSGKPSFKRNQPGFTLGGPARKDRTFYFAAYEGLFRRESAVTSILSDRSILQPTTGQRDLISALAGSGAAALAAQGQALDALLTTSATSPFPLHRTIYNLLASSSGSFPVEQNVSTASVRLDHTGGGDDQWLLRYNLTNDSSHGVGVGGLTAPSAGFDIAVRDHNIVAGNNHVFNASSVNEFRFQFVREVFNLNTVDPYGPRIAIAGVGQFGREFISPSERTQRRYQWVDNFSHTRGRHYFKMGVDFTRYAFDTFSPVFFGGQIDFARLPIPLGAVLGSDAAGLVTLLQTPKNAGGLGRPDLVPVVTTQPLTIVQQASFGMPLLINQGFGNPNATLIGHTLGLYLQDSIQATRKLHIDLGLRYDLETQPGGVSSDPNNFGPRAGFSYTPFKDNRTIIRGGLGTYYQPLFSATAFGAKVLGRDKQITNILISASPELTPVAANSICGQALAAGTPPSFCFFNQLVARGLWKLPATGLIPESAYATLAGLTPATSTNRLTVRRDDNAVNTYSVQGSLGVERQFARDWSLSINYLLNRGLKIFRFRQVNALPNPQLLDPFGRPSLTRRADPNLLVDFLGETAGSSIYHGMTAGLNKRFGQHYQLIGSYTLGKVIDDAIDTAFTHGPQDPTNVRAERSLSAFDVRHRFSLAAVFESPFKGGAGASALSRALAGFVLSPIFTTRTAFPFNVTAGIDINSDNNLNDRPFAVGRNTGRGAGYQNLDLRLARRFAYGRDAAHFVEVIFDAFNLLNRVNFKEVNGDTGGALRLSEIGRTDVRVEADASIPASRLGGFISAYDPRIVQLAVKINF
ncbi:MAG: carboxypeptidase regulatory-like domain-containing protein [Blastocatellia bacterium]|nr:carboxypeptidase regulatory-like domain-containing protein [Blastocatellia bacterium]